MQRLSDLSPKEREFLFRQLRISIAYNSNAMEGTTLSYGETKELLEHGITAAGKPLGEQLVILGFAKAYDVVIREAFNKEMKFNAGYIKDLHAIMFEDALQVAPNYVSKPIGAYRLDDRYIKGVDIKLSPPSMISQHIDNLLYQHQIVTMTLLEISEFHIKFELIHPFADGNGRIGRLLMAHQAIANDFIPPLIENDHRREYLDALADAVQLEKFLEKSIGKSMSLLG